MHLIDYTRLAQKDLKALRAYYKRPVEKAIQSLAQNPRPSSARQLRDKESWRVPVGKLRVIYKIDDELKIVEIQRIKLKKGPETYQDID